MWYILTSWMFWVLYKGTTRLQHYTQICCFLPWLRKESGHLTMHFCNPAESFLDNLEF